MAAKDTNCPGFDKFSLSVVFVHFGFYFVLFPKFEGEGGGKKEETTSVLFITLILE